MKRLPLLTLPLLLAACGTVIPDTGRNVKVTASASTITLSPDGTSDAGTTYTFTNPAGAKPTAITSATVSWGTGADQSATVTIPAVSLPAGLTCAAAATDPTAACDYNVSGTDFGARSVTAAISDSTLFAKAYAANPSAKKLPVSVTFNGAANAVNFALSVSSTGSSGGDGSETPVAKAPAPVLTINTSGSQPYGGSLSVTAAGNFDVISTVDRVILEITDAKGNVDNTTYTSTSPTATFSIDTSKFVDGNLTLKVIALTKEGLRGETAAKTVQVQNVSAPSLSILSPDANATLTGPTTVRVQLRQSSSTFTLNPQDASGNDVRLDVRDFRGNVVKTTYGKAVRISDGVYEAYIPLDLVGPDFSSNTYSLEVTAQASLADGSSRTVSAGESISTQVSDNKPPALSIMMPAYITDPYTGANVRGILSRNSALMIQASDDNGVSSLRVDFVCDAATALAGQTCPRAPYSYNIPVGAGGILFRVFEIGALLDAQPYVQNGNYTLRITAYDGSNANIQEFPVRVSRTAVDSDIDNLAGQSTVDNIVYDTRSNELNIVSARWIVPGTTANPVRVATLAYDNDLASLAPTRQRIDPVFPAGTSVELIQSFNAPGIYRVDFIVQDLVTGVTRYYQGGEVVVKRNTSTQPAP
ncbi:hypothetical protein [Deinococcus planocerae]|uniref:hypothetical protein n=1 Tax=Deinococcus planocerae TaxID=1737569 RepID=UPI000C7EBAE0|nr:hypothetical protein [Deinococcus planocerae]